MLVSFRPLDHFHLQLAQAPVLFISIARKHWYCEFIHHCIVRRETFCPEALLVVFIHHCIALDAIRLPQRITQLQPWRRS